MTKRGMGTIVALLAAGSVWCQDFSQKVTYSTVAVPIKKAVSDLGAKTGVPMDVALGIQKEIVLIDVKDAPLGALMRRMATATSCAWRKDSTGTWLLYRPAEYAKAEEVREADERTAALRKALANFAKSVETARNPADSSSSPQVRLFGGDGENSNVSGGPQTISIGNSRPPADKAVAALSRLLDLSVLGRMQPGSRLVFSTWPTRMQLPLRAGWFSAVEIMIAEQAVWAEAYERLSADKDAARLAKLIASVMGTSPGPVKGTPVKVLLCVERRADENAYSFEVKLIDDRSASIFSGSRTIQLEFAPLNHISKAFADPPTIGDAPIELTPDSIAVSALMSRLSACVRGKPVGLADDSAAKAILLQPDRRDPLSFFHSEAIMAVARLAGDDLVACLPDSLFAVADAPSKAGFRSVGDYLRALQASDCVEIEETDHWMVVKPTRPAKERLARVERSALAKLFAASDGRGYAPLDALASYALRNPPLSSSSVSQAYARMFLPGMSSPSVGSLMDWNMLRLYGSFTPGMRESLSKGSVPFTALTPAQFSTIAAMAYGPESGVTRDVFLNKPVDELTEAERESIAEPPSEEPTEMLPNGLTREGAILGILHVMEPVVQDAGDKQPLAGLCAAVNAEELAMFSFLRDIPGLSATLSGYVPSYVKFRAGRRSMYPFNFTLAKGVSMKRELRDLDIDPRGPVLAFDALPKAFRDAFADAMEQYNSPDSLPSLLKGAPAKP